MLYCNSHSQYAKKVWAENAACNSARRIFSDGRQTTSYDKGPYGRPMRQLILWWLSDFSLLSNILWMGIFGAIASLLSRVQCVREGRPQPYPLGHGAIFLLAAVLLVTLPAALITWLFCSAILSWQTGWSDSAVLLLFAGITAAAFSAVLQGRRIATTLHRATKWIGSRVKKEVLWAAGFWIGTLFGFTTIGLTVYWQTSGLRDLISYAENIELYDVPTLLESAVLIFAVGGFLAVPLLTVIVLTIISLIRRIPLAVVLVRGFHNAALPIACLLVIVYGCLAWGTTRQERIVSNGLARMQRMGYGPYYAALIGQQWPGPVP